MAKRLFLLDGMALIYRAHFAFIHRPIVNSQGVNTSALLGFTNTLLDIIETHKPTHLGVAFDTPEPTVRHEEYPEYKAQREAMPEDLSTAIPEVFRMIEAFNIPVIKLPGFEADDLIGTIAKRAEKEDFETYMVTPDKDFAQLVSDQTFLFRPGRQGNDVEIMGVPEVLEKWGIKRIDQVIEIQGLQGDAVDNIPGVPGIGPKTAQKLIAEYDNIENLLQNTDKLKGKQKERVEENKEQALLSKNLARIIIDAPAEVTFDELEIGERNTEALREICIEFELNAIGKKLLGGDFKAGRGGGAKSTEDTAAANEEAAPELKTITDVKHDYQLITKPAEWQKLIGELERKKSFCFDLETTGLDPRIAQVLGLAFSFKSGSAYYVSLPHDPAEAKAALEEFRPMLENPKIEKIGHNLNYDISVLGWQGISVNGPLFDTMLAHSLIEPDQRHKMDYLAEVYLAYTPIPISKLIGEKGDEQLGMALVPLEELADYAAEDADVTWQLHEKLKPLLKEHGQEKVFYEVEAPLIPVLVAMEREGVRIDAPALAEFSGELAEQIATYQKEVFELAGQEFNLASPKQLGEVLFDKLKLVDKPKKTKTGQYTTNEQTLIQLAPKHGIVQRILDFRQASKLKSTYADSLPNTIWSRTGRVHTTYNQAVTATGRLQSQNPNLQNIPIRTAMGREIRKAFVPRDDEHVLLSADYSQIELRIIASISKDPGLVEAFENGHDIHSATAAKVFHVPLDDVDNDQRRTAKMVNFGLAYGMSAFGLSQRLGIPRREAAEIMEEYFNQFPSLQQYMTETTEFAREHGYVETLTGRRRYLRDITSRNATVRKQAERNAVNMPVQGTAADMIKIAMSRIFDALTRSGGETKMILQVHDELVFDVPEDEVDAVKPLVEKNMREAIPMAVPIVVEIGTGKTWLEAH
jgi:DNA polymerase I